MWLCREYSGQDSETTMKLNTALNTLKNNKQQLIASVLWHCRFGYKACKNCHPKITDLSSSLFIIIIIIFI